MRHSRTPIAFSVSLLLLAACGGGAGSLKEGRTELALPTNERGKQEEGPLAEIQGVVDFDEATNCVFISHTPELGGRKPAVWPKGTTAQRDPFRLVLPDGQVVSEGDSIEGAGGYPSLAEGASFHRLGIPEACLVGVEEIVVFNNMPVSVDGT